MSVRNKALLVDIGNTRIKYVAFEGGDIDVNKIRHCDDVRNVIIDNDVSSVICAGVSHTDSIATLESLCLKREISFLNVVTEKRAFGIQCAYVKPENLGIDRWLAVLGVRSFSQHPAAIVDVGTAATCDFIVGSKHLGGWISPGFTMMREALFENTANIPAHDNTEVIPDFGQDTPECVDSGCITYLVGMVDRARVQLDNYGSDGTIYLCGGDTALLLPYLNQDVVVDQSLVFKGLARYINAENKY